MAFICLGLRLTGEERRRFEVESSLAGQERPGEQNLKGSQTQARRLGMRVVKVSGLDSVALIRHRSEEPWQVCSEPL